MDITVEKATPDDVETLHALRVAAEDWLEARGIQQWGRGGVPAEAIREQVDRGEWYLTARDGAVVGALRLLWSDPVWPEDDVPAGYLHGLVIDRTQAGAGLGARLLDWAGEHARRAGAVALRLDCVETNLALRQYYAAKGFETVGRFEHAAPWHSVVLMERRLV